MNTKTVYKIAAETSKNYWQHSKPYNSFDDLMKDFGLTYSFILLTISFLCGFPFVS